jgi:polyphenol oxidase
MFIYPNVFKHHPSISAACSTRAGGVSPIPYNSLNLGMNTGDKPENVLENRKRCAEALGFSLEQTAFMSQVHGKDVKMVQSGGLYAAIDGMVTSEKGVLLAVGIADCGAILLADPIKNIIGACHSGWKGTASNIVQETIAQMQQLGAVPQRIIAYLSPCISVQNFEVGAEVAQQFSSAFVDAQYEKPHVNLKAVIKQQFLSAGLSEENLEISNACTFDNTQKFFSYRAENGETGRMMAFIGLH